MRRWWVCRAAAWVAAVWLAVAGATGAAAQAKITTKKFRLSDFTDRVTKVVLSGNEMMDSALKQEVAERWTVSPFEFCTGAEFSSLKASDRYYFLLVTVKETPVKATGAAGAKESGDSTTDNDETGASTADAGSTALRFLTLVKGGAAGNGNKKTDAGGIEGMMEVVSVPLGEDGNSGRELVFLPAMLDIIQDFTVRAMEDEISGYSGLSIYNANYRKDGRIKRICLSLGDIAPQVGAVQMGKLDEDILLVEEKEADAAFQKGTFNTLVSFVVVPENPAPGAWCYKMLIDAETHSLYYFKRHRITQKNGAGFLPSDLRILSRGR